MLSGQAGQRCYLDRANGVFALPPCIVEAFSAQDSGTGGVYLGKTHHRPPMKKFAILLLGLMPLVPPVALAQQRIVPPQEVTEMERKLTRFNLDFTGGTPGQLVAEIQKATGRSLNAIVPPEHASRQLPPLKMNAVNVAELFRALSLASQRRDVRTSGNGAWTTVNVAYGFRATDNNLSDESIWYFFAEGDESPKTSRFYLLTPYLEAGLTVDDITTAIRTGWKMRGDTAVPVLSFHKETKLLIATGEYAPLVVIDDVLRALAPVMNNKPAAKVGEAAK